MSDTARVPCSHCGAMMLPETALKTGGLCMRCFGPPRDDKYGTKLQSSPAPTSRTRKSMSALTALDLETFPIWILSNADDDKARPLAAGRVPALAEVVVAVTLTFNDGSEHLGTLFVSLLPDAPPEFSAPSLIRPTQAIALPDNTPQFIAQPLSDTAAQEWHRSFLQGLARLERQIGQPLDQVFPIRFRLKAALKGPEPESGTIPVPSFRLPELLQPGSLPSAKRGL